MYCVAIDMRAQDGREAEVSALFQEYVPIVEAMPGTIRFEVHRDVAELAHRGDDLFKGWRPRIAALEVRRNDAAAAFRAAMASPVAEEANASLAAFTDTQKMQVFIVEEMPII